MYKNDSKLDISILCCMHRLPHIDWLVTDTRKYDHITLVFTDLQWLPAKKTIVFKILLLTFKCLHGLTPSYLSDLIVKKSSLGFRSCNQFELLMPRTHLVSYGDRAFSEAAANL